MKKFTKYLKEENEKQNYMFFSNITEIKRMLDDIEKMDSDKIDKILLEHDWASDHISVATENIEHVYKFLNSIR